MKNIIVGTAGHIDHGKTTLIKALTGRNTDRWEEEQRRGITIDLGFTYFDLKNGDRVGIIDVPGHEKFINNMVAGVVGRYHAADKRTHGHSGTPWDQEEHSGDQQV